MIKYLQIVSFPSIKYTNLVFKSQKIIISELVISVLVLMGHVTHRFFNFDKSKTDFDPYKWANDKEVFPNGLSDLLAITTHIY